MLRLVCHCGNEMTIPKNSRGKLRRCVHCGELVEVTARNTVPASPELSGRPEVSALPRTRFVIGSETRRIGEMLIDAGIISEEQLGEALDHQKQHKTRLVHSLVTLGHMTPDQFTIFLARQPGVASLDLTNYAEVPAELLAAIPRSMALHYEVFPIDRHGVHMTVAMACPLDVRAVEDLEAHTGYRITSVLASQQQVNAAIEKYYPADS